MASIWLKMAEMAVAADVERSTDDSGVWTGSPSTLTRAFHYAAPIMIDINLPWLALTPRN